MKKIILASNSPRRKELLEQIGMEFTICPSKKEEETISNIPSEMVALLSKQKAEDVWEQSYAVQADSLVIGADTVVACQDQILGKPKDEADALRMLAMLQGKEHQVYTGVTMIWQNEEGKKTHYGFYVATSVVLYSMTQEEILGYIRTGDPMDKAGAYGIQGAFAKFIKSIRGEYNNVVGLPVGRLYQEMKAFDLL